jgi:hypothetical protein
MRKSAEMGKTSAAGSAVRASLADLRVILSLMRRVSRKQMVEIALGHAETRTMVADMVAGDVVKVTSLFRTCWLFVLANSGLPQPPNTEPRGKSGWAWQIRFDRNEADAARQWVKDALSAGHAVAYSNHKEGPGNSRDLRSVSSDDEERLCRELLARGLLPKGEIENA